MHNTAAIFQMLAARQILSAPSNEQRYMPRAGIEASGPQGAIVTTPMGKTWLPGGRAHKISLGGAWLSDVPVFIENLTDRSFGDGVDGLLGLSFLGNFHVRIGGGALELRPTE
jgi:hypothetical protein